MALCLLLCRSTWFRVEYGALLTPVSESTWFKALCILDHLNQGRHGALLTPVSCPPGSGSTWRFAYSCVDSTWFRSRHGALLTLVNQVDTWSKQSCVDPPGSGSTWRFAYSMCRSTWFRNRHGALQTRHVDSTWFRVDRSFAKLHVDGSGIDMALCKLLCRPTWWNRHRRFAKLHVDPEPGSGSTWRFAYSCVIPPGSGRHGALLTPVSFHLNQGRHGALLTPVSTHLVERQGVDTLNLVQESTQELSKAPCRPWNDRCYRQPGGTTQRV